MLRLTNILTIAVISVTAIIAVERELAYVQLVVLVLIIISCLTLSKIQCLTIHLLTLIAILNLHYFLYLIDLKIILDFEHALVEHLFEIHAYHLLQLLLEKFLATCILIKVEALAFYEILDYFELILRPLLEKFFVNSPKFEFEFKHFLVAFHNFGHLSAISDEIKH